MKNHITLICLLALVLTACHKPEPEMPNGGETTQDTIVPQEPDTLVKKYLVRVFSVDNGSDYIWKSIEWNDDHSRIEKIVNFPNTHLEERFDFKYFGEDSICQYVSLGSGSGEPSLGYVYYLNDGKIVKYRITNSMNPSAYTTREYDGCGRLIRERHFSNGASQPTFGGTIAYEWEGENVRLIWNEDMRDTLEYYPHFEVCIASEYTTPHLFLGGFWRRVTGPLWKNYNGRCLRNSGGVRCDEDGYVSEVFQINEQGEEVGTFYYEYEK